MARVLRCAALYRLVISVVVSSCLWAQSNNSDNPAQRSPAEAVFSNSASKVVFLITRKSGELHANASGIILSADGYIATNYHALQGADAVEIRFFPDPADTENYQSFNGGKLLYADAERDIAILKINSKSLPFLQCPASGCDARVGETVYAIGNPKGLSNTISQGIVSGLRDDGGETLIQHSAPISPGSSGGALLDSSGHFLGMNSWQVRDAQNLNFAISAKLVLAALDVAHHATASLRFPPEPPAEAFSPEESRQRPADEQSESSKDRAVSQMRRIVEAIRKCPDGGTELFRSANVASANVAIIHRRPPRILEWDVLPSQSLRAPFQGYVRFDLPVDVQETEEAKRSKELNREYELFIWPAASKFVEYRYELDLGSDAPELRRALIKVPFPLTGSPDFKPYEPAANSEGTISCWDRIARSPGLDSEKGDAPGAPSALPEPPSAVRVTGADYPLTGFSHTLSAVKLEVLPPIK